MAPSDLLKSIEELEGRYDVPGKTSRNKVRDTLSPAMQTWLSYSRFFIISTAGRDGLDCSPRGDEAGRAFRVLNEHQIAIPDRRGNNRIDSLRNLIRDPRIGLLFLVPGIAEALRVKGTACISINQSLLDSFSTKDEPSPATVVIVDVKTAYVQNARAIHSSRLWDTPEAIGIRDIPDASQLSKS